MFYCIGYRVLLSHWEKSATANLQIQIDAGNYDESDLFELKIPAALGYQPNWTEYQSHYGQTEYKGKFYQYVKRKLSNDTLYLLCIPHTTKDRLIEARADFVQLINDFPLDQGSPTPMPSLLKLIFSEYLPYKNDQALCVNQPNQTSFYLKDDRVWQQYHPSTPGQPPES